MVGDNLGWFEQQVSAVVTLCESMTLIRRMALGRCDFSESGLVAVEVRAHQAVPEVKVEAVVTAQVLVVKDVRGGRVHELAKPRVHEPGRPEQLHLEPS